MLAWCFFFAKLNVHSKTKFPLPVAIVIRTFEYQYYCCIEDLLLHSLQHTKYSFESSFAWKFSAKKDLYLLYILPGCPRSWIRCWWCRGPGRPRSWWPGCESRGPPPSPSPGAPDSYYRVTPYKFIIRRQMFTSRRYHWCRASRPRGCRSGPGGRGGSPPAPPWGPGTRGLVTWPADKLVRTGESIHSAQTATQRERVYTWNKTTKDKVSSMTDTPRGFKKFM